MAMHRGLLPALNRLVTIPAARKGLVQRHAHAVESTAPEGALQPKKTYTAGDKRLMEAEYAEEIGYLFGEKPASDGSARIRQSWEIPFVATMTTGAILTAIGLLFKPDTNIDTWAKKEALRRKAAGEI